MICEGRSCGENAVWTQAQTNRDGFGFIFKSKPLLLAAQNTAKQKASGS